MMTKKQLNDFINACRTVRCFVSDEQALQVQSLYPMWQKDVFYKTGDRVKHNDILYKVLQDHTSQETWTPTDTPSLFAKVLIPNENVISEWEQPDSTNPYMKGDKVTYNGKTWVSTVDNNVWSPDTYGWEEI